MRHIPEEELHAYLDQALSRSQCIEIETHLAVCFSCQGERDAIAALRDRTTRLLGLAAPPARVRAPAWTELEGQAMVRRQGRSWRRMGIWAASIAGAVLAGWGLRTLSVSPVEPIAFRPQAPAIFAVNPESAPVQTVANTRIDEGTAYGADDGGIGQVGTRSSRSAPPAPAPAPGAVSRPLLVSGDWSTLSLAEAEAESGGLVARIAGLPVQLVQLQAGVGRPLMLVTQTQPSGERIFVVEGPVNQVANLVSAQLADGNGMASSDPSRSLPDYVIGADGERVRRSGRVVAVFGRLPADSLNALAAGVVLK